MTQTPATIETLATVAPPEAIDARPCVTLTLTRQTIWLTRHDPNGTPIGTHPVNASHVAKVFNGFNADSGLLPADVLFWQQRGAQVRIAVYVPPARRHIHYVSGRRNKAMQIPVPGLVFVGQNRAYSVFAALARPTTPDAEIFAAPFPNVYTDGKICVGNMRPPVASIEGMGAFIQMWWDSEFTDHLSTGRIQSTTTLYKFYQSLARATRFPRRELRPLCKMSHIITGRIAHVN